jgi:hypothetical protein
MTSLARSREGEEEGLGALSFGRGGEVDGRQMAARGGSRRGLRVLYYRSRLSAGWFCRKLLATRGGALGRHGELSLGMGSVVSVVSWFGRNRIVISVCAGRLRHARGTSMGEGARQERHCDVRLMLCPFVCGAAQK